MRRNRYYPVSQKRLPARQQAGFTLLEAVIAMVVMMVAVLGSASLFSYSIQNNSHAVDRELAMGLAQQQMEQLRNVPFILCQPLPCIPNPSLNATAIGGVTTTVTRAGRSYTVVRTIVDSNTVAGQPTMKTITTQVTPVSSTLGPVILRTLRSTTLDGPY